MQKFLFIKIWKQTKNSTNSFEGSN